MHALLAMVLSTLPAIGIVCALAAIACMFRRTRRVLAATLRFTRLHAPRWLVPVIAVCLAIPGPIDEMIVVTIGLAVILRTHRNRHTFARYLRVAWQ